MYLSKWWQHVVGTSRPDVEEAVEDVRTALDELNRAVQHLESIEGVYGQLTFRGKYCDDITSFGGRNRTHKFFGELTHIYENHIREF